MTSRRVRRVLNHVLRPELENQAILTISRRRVSQYIATSARKSIKPATMKTGV